jgi:nucleoside-diphosphate-sugar epimerase
MPVLIARIFNLLGPGLQPRHLAGYLAHLIAEAEVPGAPDRIETGDLSTTRDLVDVRDCADFLIDCAPTRPLAYANIASGVETAMDQMVANFLGRAERPLTLASAAARSREGADRIVADVPSMRSLGLPRIALDRSVADMLAYARDRRHDES